MVQVVGVVSNGLYEENIFTRRRNYTGIIKALLTQTSIESKYCINIHFYRYGLNTIKIIAYLLYPLEHEIKEIKEK